MSVVHGNPVDPSSVSFPSPTSSSSSTSSPAEVPTSLAGRTYAYPPSGYSTLELQSLIEIQQALTSLDKADQAVQEVGSWQSLHVAMPLKDEIFSIQRNLTTQKPEVTVEQLHRLIANSRARMTAVEDAYIPTAETYLNILKVLASIAIICTIVFLAVFGGSSVDLSVWNPANITGLSMLGFVVGAAAISLGGVKIAAVLKKRELNQLAQTFKKQHEHLRTLRNKFQAATAKPEGRRSSASSEVEMAAASTDRTARSTLSHLEVRQKQMAALAEHSTIWLGDRGAEYPHPFKSRAQYDRFTRGTATKEEVDNLKSQCAEQLKAIRAGKEASVRQADWAVKKVYLVVALVMLVALAAILGLAYLSTGSLSDMGNPLVLGTMTVVLGSTATVIALGSSSSERKARRKAQEALKDFNRQVDRYEDLPG